MISHKQKNPRAVPGIFIRFVKNVAYGLSKRR